MINFLRDAPYKFNLEVCDNFLRTHGIYSEFSDIVSVYMLDCVEQINTSDLSSFTSESHLHDHTNKSAFRTTGSHRMLHIKRVNNFGPILTQDSIQNNTCRENPKETVTLFDIKLTTRKISCPELKRNLLGNTKSNHRFDRNVSVPVIRAKINQKNILCPRATRKTIPTHLTRVRKTEIKPLDVFSLLFINEITQSAHQKPHKASFHQQPLQPLNKVPTSTIYFH